ncbi:MAG: hypothetical protein ACJ77K_12095 [Bacteroidia bacterium]
MKKIRPAVFFISVFFLLPNLFQGQNWFHTYSGGGNYYGWSVQPIADSGYVITGGGSESFGSFDNIAVTGVDLLGNKKWCRFLQTTCDGAGTSLEKTADGNLILTGYQTSGGATKVYLAKITYTADTIWTKSYSVDPFPIVMGTSVKQLSDGGYAVCAYSETLVSSYYFQRMVLFRMNSSGDTLWSKVFDHGTESCRTGSVIQADNGDLLICGYSGSHCYISRVDTSGNAVWERSFPGYAASEIIHAGAHNIVAAGWTGSNAMLMKLNEYGDTLWTKKCINSYSFACSVKMTPDSGYIVTGWSDTPAKIFLAKVDSSGFVQWTQFYSSPDYLFANSVENTPDGGFVVTGDGANETQLILLKTDNEGKLTNTSAEEIQIEDRGHDLVSPTIVSSGENLIFHSSEKNRKTILFYDTSGRIVSRYDDASPGFEMKLNVESGLYAYLVLRGDLLIDRGKIIVVGN